MLQATAPFGVIGDVTTTYRSAEHLAAAGGFEATVAICFANSADTLPETIGSLQEQVGAPVFELLLVTNGTTDDSVEVAIKASQGLPTRVVRCESVGYDANARNVSMQEAASSKILFLDSDDVADAAFVQCMARALEKASVVTAQWELQRLNATAFPELAQVDVQPDVVPFHHRGWTFAPAGTLGLLRDVAGAIGGFDPALSYAANNEWCFRAYAAGHPVVSAPGAVVAYRLRTSWWATARQHYRWGMWEVPAARRARGYGLPGATARQMVGRYVRVLRTLSGLRSAYGRHDLARAVGVACGHLVGSVRFRSLDL